MKSILGKYPEEVRLKNGKVLYGVLLQRGLDYHLYTAAGRKEIKKEQLAEVSLPARDTRNEAWTGGRILLVEDEPELRGAVTRSSWEPSLVTPVSMCTPATIPDLVN